MLRGLVDSFCTVQFQAEKPKHWSVITPQHVHVRVVLVLANLRVPTVVVEYPVRPTSNPVMVVGIVVSTKFICGREEDRLFFEKLQEELELLLLGQLVFLGELLVTQLLILVQSTYAPGLTLCDVQPVVHVPEEDDVFLSIPVHQFINYLHQVIIPLITVFVGGGEMSVNEEVGLGSNQDVQTHCPLVPHQPVPPSLHLL